MARILIVEDEMLIAMMLQDIVSDLGHQPVGPVMRLEPALDAALRDDFDLAILDLNLAGKQSFPIADRLLDRGIPFFFATGYGRDGLTEGYRDLPVVQKPYDAYQIALMLRDLTGDRV